MNRFSEPFLGFECVIPDGWAALPGAWARKAKLTSAPTSEKVGKLLRANADEPFLSLTLTQSDPTASIPMIQCTARELEVVRHMGGSGKVVDVVLEHLQGAYPDFQLLEREEPYLAAGGAGVYVKTAMSVLNEQGARFDCISDFMVLMAPRYCLLIGFSGPADEDKRPSADFNELVRSIRMH